ncbi:MAG: efflux RND transporter periplasmic adaptor subunit [bacterium]
MKSSPETPRLFNLTTVVVSAAMACAFLLVALKMCGASPTSSLMAAPVRSVQKKDVTLKVSTRGVAQASRGAALVAEITGRVASLSPSLEEGGFFEKDDVLIQLDSRDYELAEIKAKAELAQAEAVLSREEAESEQAGKDWKKIGEGEAPPLVMRAPQLEAAKAALAAAQGAFQKARNDSDRAIIRAPFAGRVKTKKVAPGQYVAVGTTLAEIDPVDYAEIQLPLSDDQLSFLNLPMGYLGDSMLEVGPTVTLRATFAGKEHFWQGRIVRTEGTPSPANRLFYVVARVENPYDRVNKTAPLLAGMSVEADISGKTLKDVAELPRTALQEKDIIYVVDAENKVQARHIQIVAIKADALFVQSGLEEGERVIIAPMNQQIVGETIQPQEEHGQPLFDEESLPPNSLEEGERVIGDVARPPKKACSLPLFDEPVSQQ